MFGGSKSTSDPNFEIKVCSEAQKQTDSFFGMQCNGSPVDTRPFGYMCKDDAASYLPQPHQWALCAWTSTIFNKVNDTLVLPDAGIEGAREASERCRSSLHDLQSGFATRCVTRMRRVQLLDN